MFSKILNKSAIIALLAIVTMVATTATTLALGASPLRIEYSGQPGDVVEGQLTVRNTTDETRIINISTADFMVDRDTESLLFIDGENSNYEHSLQNWIVILEDDLVVDPKSNKVINYEIRIPKDAQSKGYYGSLFIESTPLEQEQLNTGLSINLNVRVAHLVLLQVEGSLHEEVALQDFMIIQDSDDGAVFEIVMINDGNVHSSPEGVIEIISKDGDVVQELPINEGKHNVLPSSKKTYSAECLLKDFKPGIYTAVFTESSEDDEKLQAKMVIEITKDREILVHETLIGEVDVDALRNSAFKQPDPFFQGTIVALAIIVLALCLAYGVQCVFGCYFINGKKFKLAKMLKKKFHKRKHTRK